jgi:hypothetical protein
MDELAQQQNAIVEALQGVWGDDDDSDYYRTAEDAGCARTAPEPAGARRPATPYARYEHPAAGVYTVPEALDC